MEPVPPAVEAQSLNHWTTRDALGAIFMQQKIIDTQVDPHDNSNNQNWYYVPSIDLRV